MVAPAAATAAGQQGQGGPPPDTAFGLPALWRAWLACRKGKRQTRDTQMFELRLLDNLVALRDAIASASWQPSAPLSFVVERPKRREIHAAPFADRVVHHLLTERLARLYEPVFIHDSCANRTGKGTHFAVQRLQGFMRSGGGNGNAPLHALQLDIANCFNRIHRPTLFALVQQRLVRAVRRQGLERAEARCLQTLCRALLTPEPALGARRKGPAAAFERVPPHKRLACQGAGRGLPIGNLTSQFFANVYLNELDQFVKHQLKVRHYVRYVDDFVLLHEDPARLCAWQAAIADFLARRLGLALKAPAAPRPVAQGVDFLGYIVRPHYRLVRRCVVQHCQHALADFARHHVRPHALQLPPVARERLRAQVASYRAHFARANSHHLWQRLLARHAWLHQVFENAATATATATAPGQPLRPAWAPARVSGIGSQYRYFACRYPGACVLMQVGRYWLCPLTGAVSVLPARRPVQQVPGLGLCWQWRTAELPLLRQRLKRQRIAHLLLAQDGYLKTGFRRRVLRLAWAPPADSSHCTHSTHCAPCAQVQRTDSQCSDSECTHFSAHSVAVADSDSSGGIP